LRSDFEHFGDTVGGEVPRQGAQDISEHEGNVACKSFGEDGGQSGERIVGTDGDARDSPIGEDEDSSDGIDMLLNLHCNTLLVELVMLNTTGVG
jgi:hypothetical protein